ncbi:MAG: hypothetical protein A2W91_10290 [Bacteroidetes bacterium GWF2_38_335]|nr:MAG: hypothetical protein A2W91_10290 [Bacteroidetes bacterium GWF2_38_335]OFY81905.1 MAG: hypothetical protein A2281_06750 [Bacteroidetes bacterium RIFOXYA12_FULL_38_20]HBS87986.1 hypothetical protein [Bacteroidales bacterium]
MNIERAILVFFGMLIFLSGKAQIKSDWAFNLNDMNPQGGQIAGTCVKKDASGNIYVTGYFNATADFDPGIGTANMTSKGGSDIFIAKYDALGNYVFSKCFGSFSDDWGTSIALDVSGNIYLTGFFLSTADFDPGPDVENLASAGNKDIFVAKYDPSGNYIFAKSIGGSSDDWSYSIAVDGTGNAYITGYFINTVDFDAGAGVASLTSAGDRDIYIAKYDGSGNFVSAINVGGTGADQANTVTLDAAGNVFITGFFYGTADFDPGTGSVNLTATGMGDVFVAKYDGSLNYLTSFKLGGVAVETGTSIEIDASDNILVTGTYMGTVDFDPGAGTVNRTSFGGSDVFVAKYNSSGNYIYAISMGGTSNEGSYSIAVDVAGNAYITGTMQGTCDFDPGLGIAPLVSAGGDDIFLAKYNPSGNYIYANRFGRSATDYGYSVDADDSGNAYITGYFTGGTVDFDPGAGTANLVSPASLQNAFIGKYDPSGNYLMAFSLGGYPNTTVNQTNSKVVSDNAGNMILAGSFAGTVDFDPGPGNAYLTSAGQNDIYLAKYDPSGNYIFAFRLGSTFNDDAYSVFVDGDGEIYITGYFDGTFDFDPGTGTANLTGTGDVYFAKYNPSGVYIFAKSISGTSTDNGNSIFIDGSENIYLTGYFQGTADFDPDAGTANLVSAGSSDVFIAKYDPAGAYIYAKGFGGTGDDRGQALTLDQSGNILLTGYFNGTADFDPGTGNAFMVSAGSQDIFIAKYSNSGDYINAGRVGGSSTDFSYSLSYDGLSSFYICGNFMGTSDFDPGTGTYNLVSSAGTSDFFLAKYDNSFNLVFANSFGGTSSEYSYSSSIDASGDIYLTGFFGGVVDFDPGTVTTNLTSSGSADIFLAKYNASGNLIYAKNFGSTSSESGNSVHAGIDSVVFLTGYFQAPADFDPSLNVDELSSLNGNDIFAAKYLPAYPEIAVSGNSEFIFDDDATPSLTDDTDFGNSIIGSPVSHTFVIENNGEADLLLNGIPAVTVTGTGFALSTDAPSIIATGTAVSFEVTFTPDNCGSFSGNISIANNDPNENPFNFSITGNCIDNIAPIPDVASLPDLTGECSVSVSSIPTATDACAGVITGTTSDPLTYSSQGTYQINWRFEDDFGNFTEQTQNIIINDVTPPVPDIATLPDLTDECMVVVSGYPTATDACFGTITPFYSGPAVITTQGTTQITWQYFDGMGNVTYQTQNVVVDDVTPPVPDVTTLPDITADCSVTISEFPSATDACSSYTETTTDDPLYYNAEGIYIITWKYNDGNGNFTYQTQNVIVEDSEMPVPALSSLPDLTGDCSVSVAYFPTATDNCSGDLFATTSDPLDYPNQGTYLITWTFDDGNGNILTQTQNVIVDDLTAPLPNNDMLPDVIGSCDASVEVPSAWDECSGTIYATTTDPLFYDEQGTYIVTWTYLDDNGNSSIQTQNITVEDIINPEMNCANDIVIDLAEGETSYTVVAEELDPVYTWDNCEISSVTNNYSLSASLAGSVFPIGSYEIIWTVSDIAGNESVCFAQVIVNPYVGVSDVYNELVKVYPNPTKDLIVIETTGEDCISKYELNDVSGKILLTDFISESLTRIDLLDFTNGVYFLKIYSDKGVIVHKVVKN